MMFCTLPQTESARAAQHLCNGVSGVMHYVSHAYHSISDLMVDTRQLPPRVIRSHPVAHPAAIIQQTIPVQVNNHIYFIHIFSDDSSTFGVFGTLFGHGPTILKMMDTKALILPVVFVLVA